MQFDDKNKWYEALIPDEQVDSFLVGRHGNAARLLAQPALRDLPIVRMEQVHGNDVVVLRDQPLSHETLLSSADAVITRLHQVILEVRVADCLPVVLFHPKGMVGVVHAGRSGTQLGILAKALHSAAALMGSLDGLQLWFGPAICAEHYQINRATDEHYDLIGENKKQIAAVCSVGTYHLTETDLCTVDENDNFYSYRHEGTDRRNRVFVRLMQASLATIK